MKAIIPVAGIGKRLRPHTLNIPKALLNVAGKPILGHIVDSLLGMGVKELIPIVGYKGDLIREYLTAAYKVPITFVEQTEQKGIAHAVSLAREYADDSELIIILGDTIIKTDFTRIPKAGGYVLGVREVADPHALRDLRGREGDRAEDRREARASEGKPRPHRALLFQEFGAALQGVRGGHRRGTS